MSGKISPCDYGTTGLSQINSPCLLCHVARRVDPMFRAFGLHFHLLALDRQLITWAALIFPFVIAVHVISLHALNAETAALLGAAAIMLNLGLTTGMRSFAGATFCRHRAGASSPETNAVVYSKGFSRPNP